MDFLQLIRHFLSIATSPWTIEFYVHTLAASHDGR